MQNIKRFDDKPYMTIGIIVVNIIVFVLMSISGSTLDAQYMAAHGAMYPEYIKDGQSVSYTHLRAHETGRNLVCRLLLEKKKKKNLKYTSPSPRASLKRKGYGG